MLFLLLITLGSLDWFTTVIGITYFGAIEINPIFASITKTNISAFTLVKLTSVIIIGLLFFKAEKIYENLKEKEPKSNYTRYLLDGSYFIAVTVLIFTVTNNVLVVINIY